MSQSVRRKNFSSPGFFSSGEANKLIENRLRSNSPNR
jgi:hypothetical protein